MFIYQNVENSTLSDVGYSTMYRVQQHESCPMTIHTKSHGALCSLGWNATDCIYWEDLDENTLGRAVLCQRDLLPDPRMADRDSSGNFLPI